MAKNILITGASSGFGRFLALKYANEWKDVNLYLIARRGDKLDSLKNEIMQNNKDCKVHLGVGDICDRDFVRNFTKDLDIDILVNNAGLARGLSTADESDFKDWEEMIEVNIKALSFITNCVLPNMVKKGSGHIINLGSVAGKYAYRGGNIYGASKAFVKQFSQNLRTDLHDKNIRVSNIEPGLCEGSDFSLTRYKGDSQRASKVYEGTTPLHARDIADIIFWVSALPSHVNINSIEVMPTIQASGGLSVFLNKES